MIGRGHARGWGAAMVAAMVAFAGAAHGELTDLQRATILAEGQEAYDRGVAEIRTNPQAADEAFRSAAARFLQLADDGLANGRLHYNLANAYVQAGQTGRAILHYRAAQQLIPGDSRLKHNLEYARSLVQNRIAPSGGRALATALLGWHTGVPLRTRFTVFAVAWVTFWIVLVCGVLVPRPRWRWLAVAAMVVWLAGGASVLASIIDGDGREGVIVADDVVVRKGNGDGYEPQFKEPLYQGVEFGLIEQRPGWLHIELANGKTGWIRAEHAGLL